ncbi:MAG: M15 family metallopeptidase [Odoribacter sp.]
MRRIMTQAGFLTINSEWWHFDAVEPKLVAEKYKVVF